VLETSILEHRFGAEESEVSAPSPENNVSTRVWEAPTYTSEPIQRVPELIEKPTFTSPETSPVALENRNVLPDMQAAWQEWFESQEKALPEPSNMLLEDHVENEMTPVQGQSDEFFPKFGHEADEAEPSQKLAEAQESVPTVHIERIRTVEPTPEPIAPERVYTRPNYSVEAAPTASTPKNRNLPRSARKSKSSQRTSSQKGGNFIFKAVFLAIAGLSVVVMLIGTGLVDTSKYASGLAGSVTDYIAGAQNIQSK
jgi:hypothetical protein